MKWGGVSYRPPRGAYWIYYIIHVFATVVKPLFARLRCEGRENFPRNRGYVLTSNHTSGPDFIPLGYVTPQQIFFMAKSEILDTQPLFRKFLMVNGVFPIRRGEADMEAIQYAIDLVRSGKVLGMFPEGTRSRTGKLQRGRSGAARIAILAQAPVVPIIVVNSGEMFKTRNWFSLKPRAEVLVRVGKPLPPPTDPNDSRALRAYTRQIMQAMTDLLPEELRPDAVQARPGAGGDGSTQVSVQEDEE
jgi:1-acyl-sn-glycerol-3-phosphate acyltransferase